MEWEIWISILGYFIFNPFILLLIGGSTLLSRKKGKINLLSSRNLLFISFQFNYGDSRHWQDLTSCSSNHMKILSSKWTPRNPLFLRPPIPTQLPRQIESLNSRRSSTCYQAQIQAESLKKRMNSELEDELMGISLEEKELPPQNVVLMNI